jgi:carbonic anhydrase
VFEWLEGWTIPGAVKTTVIRFAVSVSLLAACAEQPPVASADHAASSIPPEAPPPASAASAAATGAAEHAESAASGEHAEHAGVPYILAESSESHAQSPINIETSGLATGKHSVKFHYQTTQEHVDNLGHTVKVTYDAGSTLDYDGKSYALQQFHFHTPSEHLLNGVTYPMELHLVHAEQGHPEHLLVVGVLIEEGAVSPWLDTLLADVPAHAGEHVDRDARLDIGSLLKPGSGYYHYEGSLTTPPYSETVTWLVLEQPRTASAEQIEALNRIEGNNARHIQARNARPIDHFN